MIKAKQVLAFIVVAGLVAAASARAQDKPASAITPLKMQVVVARYQGEKKISSMPYVLSVDADAHGANANLRMGTKIPVANSAFVEPAGADNKAARPTAVNYQDVGTNIDCFAAVLDDGRFRVQVTVDDSSVYADDQGKPGGGANHPSFRSFRAINSMVLRDGQTLPFTVATDKLTGETIRLEVTLTVVK